VQKNNGYKKDPICKPALKIIKSKKPKDKKIDVKKKVIRAKHNDG